MKTKALRRTTATLLFLGVLAAAMGLWAETVPAGTPLRVRLQQELSSKTAQSGQAFTAVLNEPLVVNGKTLAPKGTTVHGRVTKAVASGRLTTPAELYLRLSSMEIHGKSYELQTSSVGRKGPSHKKRDAVAIGGGSAVGAIIGGVAGGGKGAAIGAAAGAGAGTAGAALTGKKDIAYPVETLLTFRLRQALTVQ